MAEKSKAEEEKPERKEKEYTEDQIQEAGMIFCVDPCYNKEYGFDIHAVSADDKKIFSEILFSEEDPDNVGVVSESKRYHVGDETGPHWHGFPNIVDAVNEYQRFRSRFDELYSQEQAELAHKKNDDAMRHSMSADYAARTIEGERDREREESRGEK